VSYVQSIKTFTSYKTTLTMTNESDKVTLY